MLRNNLISDSQKLDETGSQLALSGNVSDPLVPTVFHNAWWLNATTGGNYHEAEVHSGGRLIARFPYVVERQFAGTRLCTMPELTHFLGPALDLGTGSAVTRSLRGFQLTRELLSRFPARGGFYQKLHRDVTDTLAFEDFGCRSSVVFTYEIAPSSEQDLWRAMRDKTRNVIRRAEERLRVDTVDPDEYAAFYEANLRARSLDNHYKRVSATCAAAISHGQGRILGARDGQGALRGAIFTVWDRRVAYHLMSTRAPGIDNGAMSLLVWHAMRDASGRGLIFDFDGMGAPGARLFYTGFGGRIVPRYVAARYTVLHRVAGHVHRRLARTIRPVADTA